MLKCHLLLIVINNGLPAAEFSFKKSQLNSGKLQNLPRGPPKIFQDTHTKKLQTAFYSRPLKNTLNKYAALNEKDPYGEEIISCRTTLMEMLSNTRIDLSHSSKVAWNLVNELNCDFKVVKGS